MLDRDLLRLIGRRIVSLIPVMFGIAIIVFLVFSFVPGDPITMLIGKQSDVSEEFIQQLRHKYGLDRPLYIRFFYFLRQLVHGDIGTSYQFNRPALEVVLERLPATVELALFALAVTIVIAIPAGIFAALKGGAVDRGIVGLSVVGFSMPNFWIAMLLILVFGTTLKVLPISGRLEVTLTVERVTGFYILDGILAGNWEVVRSALSHIILPALSLGIPAAALIVRLLRNNLISVLGAEFIRAARARGLRESVVIYRHALRNALIPTINIVALQLGFFLTGSFFVETVFAWPGMGRLAVDAIYARDYPVVIAAVMISALFFVLSNLLADILILVTDPRTRGVR